MTFAAIAQLLQGQRPYMLFAFRRGATEYLYTDQNRAMTKAIPGITGTSWAASAIRPGRIGDSALAARSEFKVTLPLSDAFAFSLLGGSGFEPVSLTVWRGFANDPDGETIAVFKGLVLSVAPVEKAGVVELTCMTEQAALERKGLSAVMQRPCRHTLYGRGCGLDIAAWQDELEVLAVSADGRGVQMNLPGSGAPASGYYKAGVFLYAGRYLWIVDHADDWITLERSSPELVAAMAALGTGDPLPTVELAPGCDLTTTTCTARFANLDNFGGFPWMTDSPFDFRSIV